MGSRPISTVQIQIQTRMRDQLLAVDFGIGNELVALLGRDGAGKTEILRSIAGVYTPEHGQIAIQGRTVFNPSLTINIAPSERFVGWVPHISALFPTRSVFENVAFPFQRNHKLAEREAGRRIDEILEFMGLSALQKQPLQDLDERQQHAVALARALALDPEMLLLDQPYRDLDVANQRKVRHDFQHIRRQIGVPTLLATTDLEEAYEVADRIALLDRGELLQIDAPRTLVTRPSNRQVAELVRSVNVFPGTVMEVFSEGVAVETPIGILQVLGCRTDLDEVEVVIRPEHIRILAEDEPLPVDENLLNGDLLDETNYGPLHTLSFQPDNAGGGDVLEISVSDLLFRQLQLENLGKRSIVLPARAVHLMQPPEPDDEMESWIAMQPESLTEEIDRS